MKTLKKVFHFRHCCILLALLFVSIASYAQSTLTVQGTVKDNKGEPIIGAYVNVQNTKIGDISDMNGHYLIKDVPANGILVFTYMGYKTIKKPINGSKEINVIMQYNAQELGELVVVGYGVQKKSDLTGAVSSVKANDLLKATPTGNVSDALQGQIAGVSVINSGNPLSTSTIRIRGINSVNAESGPLVVVDGFIGGSLSNLNPADIKSIEVLKDASATAVYGSRGANGVILVTTKNAKKGGLNVSFNSYVSFKQLSKYPDMLSTYELAKLSNDYGREYNISHGKKAVTYYSDEELQEFKNGKGGYDYIHHIFRNPAIDQNYELSISGGSDKVTTLASIKYQDNQGVVAASEAKRINYRFRSDFNIKKWLNSGVNIYGYFSSTKSPHIGAYDGLLIQGMYFPSTIKPTKANGEYNNKFPLDGNGTYNPMGHIWNANNNSQRFNFNAQGYINLNLAEGLTFRSQLGVSFSNDLGRGLNNSKSYNKFNSGITSANASSKNSKSWLNTNILTYKKEFNQNHRINMTMVYEQSYAKLFSHRTGAIDLAYPDELGYNALGWADKFEGNSNSIIYTLESLLGRINYVLADRYMFTVSFRADGSSRLQKKWDYFPSAAFAWDLKKEGLFKNIEQLSKLKLRLGYGVVGNQAIQPYRIYSKMKPVLLGDGTTSYVIDRPAAPDLRWERNEQTNIGIEVGLLDDRFTMSADFYNKKSKDILLEVRQPDHMGFPNLLRNSGEIQNKGLEITLSGIIIDHNDFTWKSQLTLTHNKGIFTKIPTLDHTQILAGDYYNKIFKLIQGDKIASFWGLQYAGVWQANEVDKDFLDANGKPRLNKQGENLTNGEVYHVQAGNAKYIDVNHDGKINNNDMKVIGNGQPQFNWGWSNTFRWKNFDMSLFFIGFHGFDIYNATDMIGYGLVSGQNVDAVTAKRALLNRWTPNHTDTNVPGFIYEKKPIQDFSSRFVENGSFIKLKSLTIGYTLSEKLCKKFGLNSARFYLSGQNLFTLTKYSGLDPEATLGSPLRQGADWGAYPNTRNFVLGLDLSF